MTEPSAMGGAPRLGEILVELGFVSASQLEVALSRQAATNKRLGEILLMAGAITRAQLVKALGRQFKVSVWEPKMMPVQARAMAAFPKHLVARYRVVPVAIRKQSTGGDVFYVVTSDPSDRASRETVASVVRSRGAEVTWLVAEASDIDEALARNYRIDRPTASSPREPIQGDWGEEVQLSVKVGSDKRSGPGK